MDRIERMLRLGYLPSQLPPPFTTTDLASHHGAFFAAWLALQKAPTKGAKIPKSPAAKAETFSVARAGHHQRRSTSIPGPVAQTFLAIALVTNWAAIVRHFRRSRISASHPRFRRDAKRAASLPSMQTLYERRLLQGAGFRYVLRTDVSRFFPTIYTHSIPWALHGKALSKRNRSITPKYFGNLLDQAVRQCQDEQTFGLPIGPDTSHIIAECIATAVDIELQKKLRDSIAGFRYVDDYYLFFHSQAAAEAALASLVRYLKEFELQINFEKTRVCRVEELEEDAWTHTIRNFSIAPDGQRQRSDVNHFFEIARDLARCHPSESVMTYALRRVSSVILRKDNWAPFEAHLCLVAGAHPVTLQTIARLLSTYERLGYPLNKTRLSRLINSLISDHAPLEHHSEVAWCMWMCKDLDLSLNAENIDLVSEMSSSICTLILLDLSNSGALIMPLSSTRWKQFERKEALWEDLWMLSYEAGIRCWGGMSDAHIRLDPHFDELRKKNVHFYDTSSKLTPLFTPKPDALQQGNVNSISELLELGELKHLFNYEADEDEYGGPLESEEDEEI
jgi:hypothetical protein